MAKKKRVTKKKGKKSKPRKIINLKRKIDISIRYLIIFAVLSIISYMLYKVSRSETFTNLFGLTSSILGFIALAFLIALLVFLLLRSMKK